jgi:cytoskeleton protein RodZ
VFEIGATLREARVRKRLTLQQVEDDTKIRVKYLQAMENEEFDALPGATYAKGFLRGYATYLGLDPEIILDEYRSRHRPPADKGPFSGSSTLRPRQHRRRSGLAFVAVVAVLILALIYVVGLRGNHGSAGPKVNPSVLSPSPSPSGSTQRPTGTPSASHSVAAGQSAIRIIASAACYVEVRKLSATGAPIFQATMAKGASKFLTPRGTVAIVVGGNPSSLTLIVNDQPVRTAGDKTGTVYLVANGKVSKQ